MKDEKEQRSRGPFHKFPQEMEEGGRRKEIHPSAFSLHPFKEQPGFATLRKGVRPPQIPRGPTPFRRVSSPPCLECTLSRRRKPVFYLNSSEVIVGRQQV